MFRIPDKAGLGALLHFLDVVQRKAFCFLDDVEVADAPAGRTRSAIGSGRISISHCSPQAKALAPRKRALEELQAVDVAFVLFNLVQLCQILTYIIAYAQLAF